MISVHLQGKPFNITVIQVYAPSTNTKEAEVEWLYEGLQDLLELTPKKDVLFIIRDWNAKVGSQEISGVTGKFGFGVQKETGQRLTILPRGCTRHGKYPPSTTQEMTLHQEHHHTVNTEIRLIMFFAAKDGKTLYSQQKQELIVGQIKNSLLQNTGLNLIK